MSYSPARIIGVLLRRKNDLVRNALYKPVDGVQLRNAVLFEAFDGKVVGGPPLDTPQALALHREPKANVERYDGLRAQLAGGRHAS